MRRAIPCIAVLACVFVSGEVRPMPGQEAAAPPDWTDRLESLRPDEPLAYFELAEEVADRASGDSAQLALARRLFALAGALDTPRLGRSACLALAELEDEPHVRRRLLAAASLLGSETSPATLLRAEPRETISPEAALTVTEAFSYYRRGLGSRALSKLRDDEDAMALLQSIDPLLRGGTKRFLEDCKLYNSQVRPSLSEPLRARMLQIERALLSGRQRSWSSELLLTDGAPLIEIDIQRLADMLAIDPARTIYRGGRWIRPRAE